MIIKYLVFLYACKSLFLLYILWLYAPTILLMIYSVVFYINMCSFYGVFDIIRIRHISNNYNHSTQNIWVWLNSSNSNISAHFLYLEVLRGLHTVFFPSHCLLNISSLSLSSILLSFLLLLLLLLCWLKLLVKFNMLT